jgi:hypothetical protein
MKKIVLTLLTGVLALSAIQWEYEKVYDQTEMNSHGPELTLDENGTPYILYSAGGSEDPEYILRIAEPDSGGWWITDVDTVPKYKLSFSFDINPDNEIVIAYSDTVLPGISDIYLATYHEGVFDFMNLTDDWLLQLDPMVHVGSDGIVRMVYLEYNDDGTNIRYGWYDGETFVSESIRDSMATHQYGFDFCLDVDNQPHVFYVGDDYNLWYATRQGQADWSSTSLGIRGYQPSAAMDKEGHFHIGCEDYPNLSYLTNASGSWTEETVAESEGEMDWVFPTIALDPQGIPHMVWYTWIAPYHNLALLEVWYSSRTSGSWSARESLPPDMDKAIGDDIFRIDSQGYGHVCYSIYDLYYAKTTEPLSPGITEIPSQVTPVNLEVTGSEVLFNIPVSGFVRLNLYDAVGRRVQCIASGFYSVGEYSIPIYSDLLSAGVYFVRAEIGGQAASAKFVITH